MGILAPTAWNLAGSCRNSLISCSSSTASSTPATSANVVLGMSLEASLARDLPKLMTREPPPCMLFIRKKNSTTMIAIGSRLTSRVSQMLCCGIWSSNGIFLASSWSAIVRPFSSTYCAWILSAPSTEFFRISWMVWSVPMFVADLTLSFWIWAMAWEVVAFW